MEMNKGYKIKIMGAPPDGPTNALCNNQSVVDNLTLPESQLEKKHLRICYHYVRECCAEQMVRIAFEKMSDNLADLCTQVLGQQKRKDLCQRILY